MTNGIGNPDWQRRYNFSAVPLLELSYSDSFNGVSPLIDSNGFQYLLVTTSATGSNTFDHVKVDWFQDANASIQQGFTDYTISGQSFIVQKIPVVTRYFKLEIGPVGGTPGGNIVATIYGTNADQSDLLTQNTAVPFLEFSNTVGAGTTQTVTTTGMYGGLATVHFSDDTNAIFNVSLDYYNWTNQLWRHFYIGFGANRGQAWSDNIMLPLAPVRANLTNTDTAAHNLRVVIMTP